MTLVRYPRSLQKVIEELERLPGIGPKSAQRLAFYLLRRSPVDVRALGEAITALPDAIGRCEQCANYTEVGARLCHVCHDPHRDPQIICVVSEPADLMALERAGDFRGLYHVLGGVLSPLDGVGPDDLFIRELVERVRHSRPAEVILAMNPSVEGDATAEYVRQVLTWEGGPRITRPALGLPVGAELDYADQVTLVRALQGRREM